MAAPRRKEATPKSKAVTLPGLSTRPAWQGHLRLSLVSCAVGLYKATTVAGDISFNLTSLLQSTASGYAAVESYEIDLCRAGQTDR